MNRKMLFVFWLLFVLATTALAQVTKVCSDRPSTTYIYVNGIWNTLDEANQNLDKLSREFRFATSTTLSSPSLDDCVKFRLAYNKSQGKLKDMIQVIGQIGEEKAIVYSQSLEGLNKEHENVISGVVLSLWRTVNSIGNELLAYASTSAVNYTQVQSDLNDLITAIKEELGAGNKVVLVGHSQGNLFVNAAYDYMIKNSGTWQTQTGNRLPDNTKLAVLGISVPSDHVADKTEIASRIGRQRYTTDCVDFIWTSFSGFLPYNVRGNSTNGLLNEIACDYHLVLNAVQEALGLLSPMAYFQKPDSQATVSLVKSANPTLISKLASIGKEWVTDKVFWGVLETGAPFRHHKLENYLTRNSPTWKQITFDLVAELPNLPFLTVSESCLYCESFTNTNPWWKYQWENVPGDIYDGEATLQYGSLMFTTRAKAMVYQTSQQFFGRISAKVEFTHQGQGESRITITKGMNGPKVADLVIGSEANINAARLSIYNASGSGVVGSPVDLPISYNRKVFTAEVDSSEVRLYVDGDLQLKQGYSNTSQSTSSPSGFYVQLASNSNPGVGRNILLVHKVEVTRLTSSPLSYPSFTLSLSQSQSVVTAGKSVDFAFSLKSNNGYAGKVTVEPFGLPVGTSATNVTVDIPANQTVNGKFTVSTTTALKVGDYNVTVTATGSGFRSDPVMQTLSVRGLGPVVAPPTNLKAVVK
jgi:hypothetical protein